MATAYSDLIPVSVARDLVAAAEAESAVLELGNTIVMPTGVILTDETELDYAELLASTVRRDRVSSNGSPTGPPIVTEKVAISREL